MNDYGSILRAKKEYEVAEGWLKDERLSRRVMNLSLHFGLVPEPLQSMPTIITIHMIFQLVRRSFHGAEARLYTAVPTA